MSELPPDAPTFDTAAPPPRDDRLRDDVVAALRGLGHSARDSQSLAEHALRDGATNVPDALHAAYRR